MLESTKLEKSAAEEERGHAHEQVLSLIRECNALEEQIHRLSKDKCRLQEQVSSLENDLRKVRDHAQEAKDQLAMKVEQLVAIEKQLKEIKVMGLEEKLRESQTQIQHLETEGAQLRAQVTTLSTQLAHARRHTAHPHPHADRVGALEGEVSRLAGQLAARDQQLKQVTEQETREKQRVQELQQEVATLTKSRNDALHKVSSMEATLGDSQETLEATKMMEKLWEAQLANIEEEMARLLCESNQLKDCNSALHEQLSARDSEMDALRRQVRAREAQVEELRQARDLLANDAQVVVAAVKQWLHEQKTANSKLAGKLHHQNKQILLLNTEKQFLAERNTSLQRTNHDLSVQLHDLRVRVGLPLTPTPPEKVGKIGRIASPSLGTYQNLGMSPTRPLSTGAYLDNFLGLSSPLDTKYEDVLSTCSSEGGSSSSSGCQVPGLDLPGASHLERLAHLADSLLIASRNISRASGLISSYNPGKITSAISLGDLTSSTTLSQMRSTLALSKATSSSTGNLASFLSHDRSDDAMSPVSKLSGRVTDFTLLSPGPRVKCRGNEVILAAPVKERRSSLRMYNNDSIEEADEEEVPTDHATSKIHTLHKPSSSFRKSSRTSPSSSILPRSCSASQGSSRTSPASSTSQGSSSTLHESSSNLHESSSTLKKSSSVSSVSSTLQGSV
ncbi:polyamine-modulated factor 1-binding protein 1 isoform X3 [Cherax quadricarinatus]